VRDGRYSTTSKTATCTSSDIEGERWEPHNDGTDVEIPVVEPLEGHEMVVERGMTQMHILPLENLEPGVHRVGLEMRAGEDSPTEDNAVEVYARLDVDTPATPIAIAVDGGSMGSLPTLTTKLPFERLNLPLAPRPLRPRGSLGDV
jgi:hypothetical protein